MGCIVGERRDGVLFGILVGMVVESVKGLGSVQHIEPIYLPSLPLEINARNTKKAACPSTNVKKKLRRMRGRIYMSRGSRGYRYLPER